MYKVPGTMYEVPSTKYEVDSEAKIENQETCLTTGRLDSFALCYEIHMVYEFPLLHSSISVRRSILKRSEKQEARTETCCSLLAGVS